MKLGPASDARCYERGGELVLLGRDGVARSLDGDSARLARAILDFVSAPRERSEIFAHLEALVGGPVEPSDVVDELLATLRTAGILVDAGDGGTAPSPSKSGARRRVVLCLTGAVATVRAPELVSRLLARGFEVEVALTRDARRFVTPLGLEALTHRRVYTSLWQRDTARPVPHIQLAEWAELVLVCPASATTLSRIAHGDCSDLVSAIAVATRAPVVLVPSMNRLMLDAPSVQRNLEQLRSDGFHLVRPGQGVEAARGPAERTVGVGPSASLDAVIDIVRFVVDRSPRRSGAHDPAAHDQTWEEIYASAPLDQLPWFTDAIDPELVAALDRLGLRSGPLLDLGCGPGTVAIEMGRRGFAVTATDLSPTAIARASQRPGADAVQWKVDDLLATRLTDRFDVVVDRGCLHSLPQARVSDGAAAITQLVRPGGHLLLKTHRSDARHPAMTLGFNPLTVAQLFGDGFDLVHSEAAAFQGPWHTTEALFCVLRRHAPRDDQRA